MTKQPKTSAVVTEVTKINCQVCRHFTGYSYKFGCAKGHALEESWSFTRDSCIDNSPLRRDELIFKRFSPFWSSEEKLKNKKSVVRRTSTGLRTALTEFEKVLDADQITAIKAAAEAFDRLGDDIGRAAQLAKQHDLEQKAQYLKERQAKLDSIAASYFGIAGDIKVLEIAYDMDAFIGEQGMRWYRPVSGDGEGYISVYNGQMTSVIRDYEASPSPKTLRNLKTRFAECIEELQNKTLPSFTANLEHFNQFRIWRTHENEIARMAAANPVIVQLKR